MLERVEIFIRLLRNYLSRSGIFVRLFGLSVYAEDHFKKGLVIIQIDALSKKQLEKAVSVGKVPFLKNLLDKQHYQLLSHYSGMPCSTASVQAELFYGVKSAVPAFRFYDSKSNRIFTMFNPQDALEMEHRLEKQGKALLDGGCSYSNIYSGGAGESHFCISTLGVSSFFKKKRFLSFFGLIIFHFYSLIRTAILLLIEVFLALVDFFRGLIKGRDLWKELKFVPSRVAMCVLLRELVVIGAKIDITRGVPIVHLNLMGYHEQSHRRGPSSRFAQWTLRGIDDAVKRIWIAAHISAAREYDVWIYSDHGQIDTVSYEKKFGKSVQQSVIEAFDYIQFSSKGGHHTKRIGFLARAGFRRSKFFKHIFTSHINGDSDEPIITALGPVGHIYLKSKLEPQEIERFALNLISHANIPMVILPKGNDRNKTVGIWTENGHFIIPDQANEIFDADAPFFSEMVQDFINACHHTDSGDLIICGRQVKNNTYYTFAIENGSHGGISTEEAEGFALLPKNMSVGRGNKKYVRPLDLRAGAFELLGAKTEEHDKTYIHPLRGDKVLRIMTYNVHGCVGMDGRLSPRRVAEVISQYEPDIVALQELDVGRLRSGREDQAMLIAERLNMEHYFHASMRVAEESFGNAILSSYPMKLIKKGSLSKLQRFSSLESRGALWVQVEFNTLLIQIINTHLGLNSQERLMQSRELFSKSWLRNPQCIEPVILCGDFNAIPGSKVFKLIHNNLASVQAKAKRRQRRRTWFGRYPFACLDHIFASSVFEVVSVEVCDSYLARLASDHRPLLADLKMP